MSGCLKCWNRCRRKPCWHILSDYNADLPGLFTQKGLAHIRSTPLTDADRFAVDQWLAQWKFLKGQLREADLKRAEFAEASPAAQREARELLRSIPGDLENGPTLQPGLLELTSTQARQRGSAKPF